MERLDNAPPCPSRCILRSSRRSITGGARWRPSPSPRDGGRTARATSSAIDGGRAYPIVHAGAFKTLKDAKSRRDLVAGEIAHGRNPAELLAAMTQITAESPTISLSTWGERFLASRIDVDANTKKNYASALKKIGETFGDRDPSTITVTEIAEWIAVLAETRKPERSGST